MIYLLLCNKPYSPTSLMKNRDYGNCYRHIHAKGGFAAVEQYLPNMPIFERGLEIHVSDRPHSLQTPNQQRQTKP